ncbi:hypothetical protein EYF80_011159 [Liparis tanakae]|uniref:Uncharacterized protein n=1 Tax=Liparis tanakae TaxID=230148 RepID=A0A4Z2IM67_9TELE|nr:hypothetical protein EYF80_011159 [Liparis tanakae]
MIPRANTSWVSSWDTWSQLVYPDEEHLFSGSFEKKKCIEGVFGGAAERALGDHLHGVEQPVAVSPKRTAHLQNLLELGADVPLAPQTLSYAPVGKGKDDFVWARNTEIEKDWSEAMPVHRGLGIQTEVKADENGGEFVPELLFALQRRERRNHVDPGVVAQALSVGEAQGLVQTGPLGVQEQGPPDGVLLVLLHTVQLDLHHKGKAKAGWERAGSPLARKSLSGRVHQSSSVTVINEDQSILLVSSVGTADGHRCQRRAEPAEGLSTQEVGLAGLQQQRAPLEVHIHLTQLLQTPVDPSTHEHRSSHHQPPPPPPPTGFPPQSLNPTVPWGLLFTLFMELSLTQITQSKRVQHSPKESSESISLPPITLTVTVIIAPLHLPCLNLPGDGQQKVGGVVKSGAQLRQNQHRRRHYGSDRRGATTAGR